MKGNTDNMEEAYLVDHDELTGLGTRIFITCGLGEEDARIISESLVRSDARGVKSHGVVRIPSYIQMFRDGDFGTDTTLVTLKETPVSAVLDAGNAPGAVVSKKCCEITRKKAKKIGMAMTVVRNSNHFGEAAYWSLLLAQKDMLGFVTTNSISTVAAPNGISRAIGSNPFSWAVPAGKYANICLDVAVGYMAQGKIFEYQRLKKQFPENAWLGPDGVMTTDSAAFALPEYIMMPFGNHKGFGLGVIMETMTSMLSGSMFHSQPKNAAAAINFAEFSTSHCFQAIDIGVFEDLNVFRSKVDQYIEYLHSLPVKEGAPGIVYPGEIESKLEERSIKEGVAIDKQVLDDMLCVAKEKGIDVSYFKPRLQNS
jgi:LDH2 family malate/lactate/ureidoglycolate dehydrogenase